MNQHLENVNIFLDILKTEQLIKMHTRSFNPIALRKAKIVYNFDLSERNRVKPYHSNIITALEIRSGNRIIISLIFSIKKTIL